ncbi:hypothetical protein G5C51_01800 [Streptomyces sp. A7024]|uniref:DUF7144 domain-containing protein n=1 Tax=Streptomyces coryli TaxID=1128680 RepID=A0A6G4TRJ9_9ACTN|nr:hypothetical protein [Streptomyces coryli]NGN62639.1 hypothetical protein [Streptomyces coryli]
MAQKTYAAREVSGWTVGLVLFAGIMMITVGLFQAIQGFAAILENEFYVNVRNYAFEVDVTAWGWIHLILGLVLGLAGWGVITGALWGRMVGIALAVLSAIVNFFFIPYYPLWSMLIIALDVFVIWALCVYGRSEAEQSGTA